MSFLSEFDFSSSSIIEDMLNISSSISGFSRRSLRLISALLMRPEAFRRGDITNPIS